MTQRRDFLAQMGSIAALLAVDASELQAASAPNDSSWDTSWLAKLASAQFKVVFNASDMSDGAAMDYAATFLDHFHDVHATSDKQTRPVIVFRRLGTAMALNDLMWDKYSIGEDTKTNDPATSAPAKRNVYWRGAAGSTPRQSSTKIETLHQRGLISLVCNIALGNWSARAAEKMKRPVEEVRAEARANLVPGAILVPSGIYGLIRAQNAGCAYMPGT